MRTRLPALLALCLLTVACAAPRLLAPEIQAAALGLKSLGMFQQQFLLTLRVYNPNTVSLPVESIHYQFELAGTRLAEGETVVGFSIPAGESRDVQVNVRTDLLGDLQSLNQWLAGAPQALEYRLVGELRVDMPFVRPMPFAQQGSVPLGRAH